jgi:hypothetical protein
VWWRLYQVLVATELDTGGLQGVKYGSSRAAALLALCAGAAGALFAGILHTRLAAGTGFCRCAAVSVLELECRAQGQACCTASEAG